MKRAISAGLAYCAGMFALGFLLGTIRVLLVEPRVGNWVATLLELPAMLVASWFYCGWLLRLFAVPALPEPRAVMGGIAFTLLMLGEVLLGISLFDRSVAEQLREMVTGASILGLVAQVAYAVFPLAQLPRRAEA